MVNIKEIIIVCWYAVVNDGEKLSKDSTCNHDAGIQILDNEYAVGWRQALGREFILQES